MTSSARRSVRIALLVILLFVTTAMCAGGARAADSAGVHAAKNYADARMISRYHWSYRERVCLHGYWAERYGWRLSHSQIDARLASIASSASRTPCRAWPAWQAAVRGRIIARARTWAAHPVPYSQHATHGGYRTDCSGYASMAIGLPRPGMTTATLWRSSRFRHVPMSALHAGDLVDNPGSHVVIFERWTSGAHSSYWAYEQHPPRTVHRVLRYGLRGDGYHGLAVVLSTVP